MSGKDDREGGWGPVTEAALALERELRRFEQLTVAARRMGLDTRRGLERAAVATTEAAQGQERVNGTLGALVQAINAARERHEGNAAALQVRGEEIRGRAEVLGPLYERFAALGEESRVIHQLVQEAAALQREASTTEAIHEVVAAIQGIEERMGKLAEVARELGAAATAASVSDVAEQSDALRQQIRRRETRLGC